MDDYELKRDFAALLGAADTNRGVLDALRATPDLLLSWDDIERYQELDPGNARLRALMGDTVGTGMWRFLWLPPSLPYYSPAGAFEGADVSTMTKRLVFSSWQVVPKVVASLLSYEAERLMFGGASTGEERPNSQEARDKRRPLLRFARSDGRLTGLPLLSLFYPAMVLAEVGDPLVHLREASGVERLTAGEVLERVTTKLVELLDDLPLAQFSGPVDEAWYWAAPILLDLRFHEQSTREWFGQSRLADIWKGEGPEREATIGDEQGDESEAWRDHVAEAQKLIAGRRPLGPRPADLASVIAHVAIGAPATVAMRALSRVSGGAATVGRLALRNDAATVGWAFRTLFNLPEVTAMIRAINADEPYWLRVVEYCVNGCLQSVLDEFAHILLESEGVAHRPAGEAVRKVAQRMRAPLQLRTATLAVDAITIDSTAQNVHTSDKRMRARFAARYGAKQSDDRANVLRQDDVRSAFNSPFWPFVLSSTSVGQEGLDFHPYCHAVVHWNLPSNPVDLEQREGRVHRYKGHAVRKNVVRLHGRSATLGNRSDPWASMFHAAVAARDSEATDLVPFWVLPVEGGAKIERHVPALPLSRDASRADLLRRALVVYRMAFGQARQEDLVQYLQQRLPQEAIRATAAELRIDLSPPKSAPLDVSSYDVERVEWRAEEVSDEGGWTLPAEYGATMLTADTLLDLLDEFSARLGSGDPRLIVDGYRDLLDAFARSRGAGM